MKWEEKKKMKWWCAHAMRQWAVYSLFRFSFFSLARWWWSGVICFLRQTLWLNRTQSMRHINLKLFFVRSFFIQSLSDECIKSHAICQFCLCFVVSFKWMYFVSRFTGSECTSSKFRCRWSVFLVSWQRERDRKHFALWKSKAGH